MVTATEAWSAWVTRVSATWARAGRGRRPKPTATPTNPADASSMRRRLVRSIMDDPSVDGWPRAAGRSDPTLSGHSGGSGAGWAKVKDGPHVQRGPGMEGLNRGDAETRRDRIGPRVLSDGPHAQRRTTVL